MQNIGDLALCVRDELYNSGFFRNFEFKNRVFEGCPRIWNSTQTIKNIKRLRLFADNVSNNKTMSFYYLFNKQENRRLQICKWLGYKLGLDIPFDDKISGELYLSQNDIKEASKNAGQNTCFIHTRGASALKSAIPKKLMKDIQPEAAVFFTPPHTDNINMNFARQKESSKIAIVDSLYLHSAGALGKDIDLLFVSATVKPFFHTLIPKNIKIKKIIYGSLYDSMKALFYYSFMKKLALTG